jgi:phospholipid:diacylglycerol acyltransferase
MGAFSLWGPLIESLSDLGYDERNVDIAAYDWRLSMSALEERDRYFSRLLASIELFGAINAEPRVVVVTHSFGSNVFTYFMQWARQPRPLGGGKNDAWFDAHVASWINIAGPLLGVCVCVCVCVLLSRHCVRCNHCCCA